MKGSITRRISRINSLTLFPTERKKYLSTRAFVRCRSYRSCLFWTPNNVALVSPLRSRNSAVNFVEHCERRVPSINNEQEKRFEYRKSSSLCRLTRFFRPIDSVSLERFFLLKNLNRRNGSSLYFFCLFNDLPLIYFSFSTKQKTRTNRRSWFLWRIEQNLTGLSLLSILVFKPVKKRHNKVKQKENTDESWRYRSFSIVRRKSRKKKEEEK